MLMKYFTFTSICLLAFCMFLALSGTTELPADYSEQATGPQQGTQEHQAKDHKIKETKENTTKQASAATTGVQRELESVSHGLHRRIINLSGLLLFIVWIFLSLKLLSIDLPNKSDG